MANLITLFGDLHYDFLNNSKTFNEADENYPSDAQSGTYTGTVHDGGCDTTTQATTLECTQEEYDKGVTISGIVINKA